MISSLYLSSSKGHPHFKKLEHFLLLVDNLNKTLKKYIQFNAKNNSTFLEKREPVPQLSDKQTGHQIYYRSGIFSFLRGILVFFPA